MDETAQTVSLAAWIEGALADMGMESGGIEFYEFSGAPVSVSGLTLLKASCALLDAVRGTVRDRGFESGNLIPYVKFRLANTRNLLQWNPELWSEINGYAACVELSKQGSVFYWGTWESHHETLRLPIDADPQYVAIFRRCKGFYDGEPWDEYSNEIFVFASPA